MNVTIREIARNLKLSPSTVSKALSGKAEVSEQTRARVTAYAGEQGYTSPTGRTQTKNVPRVAILIQHEGNGDISSALFYDMLLGFKQYAKQRDFEVVILTISDSEQENCTYDTYIRNSQIDGVFIMGLKTTDPYYNQLATTTVHSVALDIVTDNSAVGAVEVDNIAGARLAIEHLAALGHKRIGFINGHSEAYVSMERLTGYMAAMCGCGFGYDPELVFVGDFTEASGAAGSEFLLSKGVTAIFCASDLMAIGAERRLRELSINVPKDISIIGFDNVPLSAVCSPPLTTIAQDRLRIGVTACAILDCLMNGMPINHAILPPTLVIRESTGEVSCHDTK